MDTYIFKDGHLKLLREIRHSLFMCNIAHKHQALGKDSEDNVYGSYEKHHAIYTYMYIHNPKNEGSGMIIWVDEAPCLPVFKTLKKARQLKTKHK